MTRAVSRVQRAGIWLENKTATKLTDWTEGRDPLQLEDGEEGEFEIEICTPDTTDSKKGL